METQDRDDYLAFLSVLGGHFARVTSILPEDFGFNEISKLIRMAQEKIQY